MKSFSMGLPDVLDGIEAGRIILPALQREFVWREEKILPLFDSLMREYPMGSLLVWRLPESNRPKGMKYYEFLRKFNELDSRHNPEYGKEPGTEAMVVLDGQQRLTSLYIGIRGSYATKTKGKHKNMAKNYPERRLHLNLAKPLLDSGDLAMSYDFRFLANDQVPKNDDSNHWVRISDVAQFSDQEMATYCAKQGLATEFSAATLFKLHRLLTGRDDVIHLFETKDPDINNVLQIFVRTNSGGTKLSYSDLLLSFVTVHWPNATGRDEILGLVDELNKHGSLGLSKDYVLKAALYLTDAEGIQFKVENFDQATVKAFHDQWEDVRNTLIATAEFLQSLGFDERSLVAPFATLPIAYQLHHDKTLAKKFLSSGHPDVRKARREATVYLAGAFISRTFTGGTDSTLRTIRTWLNDGNQFDARALDKHLRTKAGRRLLPTKDDIEDLFALKKNDRYTYAVLAALYPGLASGAQKTHVDHVHALACTRPTTLKAMELSSKVVEQILDERDTLVNLQLLPGLPNEEKGALSLSDYTTKTFPTAEERKEWLRDQLIPEESLDLADFQKFSECRKKLITKRLLLTLGAGSGVTSHET